MTASPAVPELNISDDDLQWIESQLSLRLDSERRAILSCLESRDVRACPGSGKTTLVVAKLAILARKWKSKTRGICVLSHTNVAREEIRQRFASCPALGKLDHFPHFVGTIQSFIDLFLGIPGAMAKFQVRPQIIDDDRCAAEIKQEFYGTALYENAKTYLRRQFQNNPNMDAADYVASLRWHGSELELRTDKGNTLLCDAGTNTGIELHNLKTTVSKRGWFCFSDLSALARAYLREFPLVMDHLGHRFPLVIVDEAQDTPASHSEIIDQIFAGRAVLQRIGDDRQAIFSNDASEEGESVFPRAGALSMPTSLRLSPKVAKLAEGICFGHREALGGNPIRDDGRHSIILFETASIGRVLPTFAQLVAEDVGVNLPSREVRAVAATGRRADEPHKFPMGLADYWDGFQQKRDVAKRRINSFAGYAEAAEASIRKTGCVKEAVSLLIYAVARLLRLQEAAYDAEVLRSDRLLAHLAEHDSVFHDAVRKNVFEILKGLATGSTAAAGGLCQPLIELLVSHTGGELTRKAKTFVNGLSADGQIVTSTHTVDGDNIFEHATDGGVVRVTVDTIHSVKGETVSAILVLESFVKSHHFKKLIEKKFLYGNPGNRDPGVQVRNHIKRTFVGMTRPTKLLCLAMPKDYLDDDGRRDLTSLGWSFIPI